MRKYILPLLAVAGIAITLYAVRPDHRSTVRSQPPVPPPRSPYAQAVSGVGLVEASTQNITIGTHVAGVVGRVFVRPGQGVEADDPLFVVDDRPARAELEVRRAALSLAEQELSRLRNAPRAEDVRLAKAKVAEAEARLDDAKAQLASGEAAGTSVAKREIDKRLYGVKESQARLAQAHAQLDLLTAGTWKPDLEVAAAQVALARAQVNAAQTDLERLTVHAPVDGEVLQVNVRVGQFAPTGELSPPLMILGDTRTLHLRVNVDEYDAWRVRPDAAARASLRGNSEIQVDLTFVRIEPYVVPKKSLTGAAPERVDTRVLQVLYSFQRGDLPVYVGQQMDVYIDASPPGDKEAPK